MLSERQVVLQVYVAAIDYCCRARHFVVAIIKDLGQTDFLSRLGRLL